MSIFDNHTSPESIDDFSAKLQAQKKEEELIGSYLRFGVKCIEVEDVKAFGDKVEESLSPSYEALDDFLQSQKGRPVYRWDIRGFKKYDAAGSLYTISKLPKSPKPVVIIENITEIPVGDPSIYDDPKRVEELMLHNWKNESSSFDEVKFGHFEIKPGDYSVLIPWNTKDKEKIMQLWRTSDGIAWCSIDWQRKWFGDY